MAACFGDEPKGKIWVRRHLRWVGLRRGWPQRTWPGTTNEQSWGNSLNEKMGMMDWLEERIQPRNRNFPCSLRPKHQIFLKWILRGFDPKRMQSHCEVFSRGRNPFIYGLARWRLRDPFVTTSNPFRIKTSEKFTSKNFRCFDPKAAKFSVVFMRNGSVEVIIRAFSQSIIWKWTQLLTNPWGWYQVYIYYH